MLSSLLDAEIALWLSERRKQIEPRFPPACEAAFQKDTAEVRLRALRISILIGVVTGILMAPTVWQMMPKARSAVLWVWGGTAIPIGFLSWLCTWMKLPVRWQEIQAMICGVLVALAFSVMMTWSDEGRPATYLGGMTLLIMLDVIAAGFRFRIAVTYSLILTAMFGIFLQQMPQAQGLFGYVLLLLLSTCSVFAVFGAWRVETEMRRSYALMLREKLKQQLLRQRNSELDELALRDALTGLANRRSYETWKALAWSAAESSGNQIGLLVLDVDNFKLYNDAFGHSGGDQCLRAVAQCLAEQLRGTTDMVARVGGEEFAIILPGADLDSAGAVAERVRQAIEALDMPHAKGAANSMVTISCGAASLAALPGRTPEDLFAAADGALYAAKRQGRNRVCLADISPRQPVKASSGLKQSE